MTYYIYHIKGKKIGCSTNPKKRVRQTHGYKNFEILETHDCIYTASDREQELQKQYGYEVDDSPYYVSYENLMKGWSLEVCKLGNKSRKIMGHTPSHPINVYKDNKFIGTWESISECARQLNLDKGNISRALRGVFAQYNGYTFEKNLKII